MLRSAAAGPAALGWVMAAGAPGGALLGGVLIDLLGVRWTLTLWQLLSLTTLALVAVSLREAPSGS